MAVRKAGYKAGEEIDSKCTKCKMVLAHTIVAMVGDTIKQVKCNTCGGVHAYRPPPSASEATAKKRRADKKATPEKGGAPVTDYDAATRGKNLASAKPYSMQMPLERDDVIAHDKFGTGVVTDIKEDNKAYVVFPDGPRTLVYNRA